MTQLDLALIVLAAVAALASLALAFAFRGVRNALRVHTATLRGALDVAGVERIEDAVEAVLTARRRIDAVAALVPAADEIAERQARLTKLLTTRDDVGNEAQNALRGAAGELESTSAAVGDLSRDIGVAGAALEETVSSISTVSTNIGGLADNVSSVSSSIGELAVSVNQVATSAREASTLSLEADRKAKDGGVAVERLVRSTREIADDIGTVVNKMKELGSASERISAIVEVIDTIADQTNLLALNAAIEAARAGEHGRGFAVVADEVRKLAESSAKSTREIALLVKDIQAKTAEVVRSTTASGGKAENGLEMADLAGRAIGDISSAVGEANRLIEQISMAAREQAAGSSAIANSVEAMNQLMREAAQSLDEQNSSNQQIITVIAQIQGHAQVADVAVNRQRAAFGELLSTSRALAAAGTGTRAAREGIDEIAESLRDRLHGIAGGALAKQNTQLTGNGATATR